MEVAVSGRRASVRGRRKAAAGWRSQARGVDLRNVLGGAGNAHEADVTLGLAVPDPPPHGREVGGETGPESLWSGNFMAMLRIEGGAVDPQQMEDDGELAGERGSGFPGAAPTGEEIGSAHV